jgi:hypothetical protein
MNRSNLRSFLALWRISLAVLFISLGGAGARAQFQIVHAFGATGDANALYSQVALDANGNLYGTGAGGGAYNNGAVFELSPNGDGSWNEAILHSFGVPGIGDGTYPYGPVTLGSGGILYGVTTEGGSGGYGVVYSLASSPAGWEEVILHGFTRTDNIDGPASNLAQDAEGNLYGRAGVFELSPGSNGWIFSLICSRRNICSGNDYDGTSLGPGQRLFSGAWVVSTASEMCM